MADDELEKKTERSEGARGDELSCQVQVSAVVVTYFTGPLLARAIDALREQAVVTEIIIVDNGNWEGEVDRAVGQNRVEPLIKIITGHGNVGFATACNLGARSATGDFLLFLNPDAILPVGAVEKLIADVGDMHGSWVVGPKLVNADGTEQQGSRRETLTPWRAFVEATRLYKVAPNHPYFQRFNLHNDPCPGHLCETPTISGACFLLPRGDYQAIGGMDERYFLHVEDIDFFLRFSKAGGKVFYDPLVAVVHYKGSSRASKFGVERRKVTSAIKYFDAHFSDAYPRPFLLLVSGLLWVGFFARESARIVKGLFSVLGLSRRRGTTAVSRAKSMNDQRSAR
ncbi:MAG: glycosyltransferase [Alphaproteobacteria bacterium]|nr:glycosyltransferase [Alphaproteobacteria bacterium]